MSELEHDEPNPYSAPADAPPSPREFLADPKWLKLRSVAIALIVSSGLIGVLGTMFGMIRSFRMAAEQQNVNPGQLAGDLSMSVMFLVLVAPILLFGVALLIVSMIKLSS